MRRIGIVRQGGRPVGTTLRLAGGRLAEDTRESLKTEYEPTTREDIMQVPLVNHPCDTVKALSGAGERQHSLGDMIL